VPRCPSFPFSFFSDLLLPFSRPFLDGQKIASSFPSSPPSSAGYFDHAMTLSCESSSRALMRVCLMCPQLCSTIGQLLLTPGDRRCLQPYCAKTLSSGGEWQPRKNHNSLPPFLEAFVARLVSLPLFPFLPFPSKWPSLEKGSSGLKRPASL